MSTTTFYDGQTVIYASWLNDVNNAVYNGSFPNGVINVTSLTATTISCTNLTATNFSQSFGSFTLVGSGTKLYIKYNGSNVASIDSSGNFISLGNNTANSHISSTSPTP